jgi:hypothetical protein
MRFVPTAKAKIKVGEVVYTINDKGQYNIAKLIGRTEDEEGIETLFEVPQFFDPKTPAINSVCVKNIVMVCRMKDKKDPLEPEVEE